MHQNDIIAVAEKYGAHNYQPLPLVITRAEGIWVWDLDNKRYMDCLSAYSALNQGHRHPAIIKALISQAGKVTLTSRAFHNDQMGAFLEKLCHLAEMDRALPMNTGVEAVETAIKLARKWGYQKKGIESERAEIIVCKNNFHGRTLAAISMSSESAYRDDFGPFAPGFRCVDYDNLVAIEAAISAKTAAVLLEPIQGEAGIRIPHRGYLDEVKALCRSENILLIADEIQTGLGRTGKMFCYQHELDAKPDILILGKALGGGVYPVSAVLANDAIMDLLQPGQHGSTFGGNPLAAAVGLAALQVLEDQNLADNALQMGNHLDSRLRAELKSPVVKAIRGRGLMVGIELHRPARDYCEALMLAGFLCKETHETVIRVAPPLTITRGEIDLLVDALIVALNDDKLGGFADE